MSIGILCTEFVVTLKEQGGVWLQSGMWYLARVKVTVKSKTAFKGPPKCSIRYLLSQLLSQSRRNDLSFQKDSIRVPTTAMLKVSLYLLKGPEA
eukprot:g37064.t1